MNISKPTYEISVPTIYFLIQAYVDKPKTNVLP